MLVKMFEEALPGKHIYGMYSKPKQVEVSADIVIIKRKRHFLKQLKSRDDWEGIIFNPCDPICWRWLPHIPKNLKVYWYRWGYEYYGWWKPLMKNYQLLPQTKSWVARNRSFKGVLMELGMSMYSRMERRQLKRINYFVSPEYEEYLLLKEVGLLHRETEYQFGCVGFISQFTDGAGMEVGKHILLGNSADPTNNHMEAIDWLSTFDLGDRKVITPLNYGDRAYRQMICEYGEEKLGSNFEPIKSFLPFETYQEILRGCGYAVMNHLRLQAGGNISQMLANGGKVFMNNTSLYQAYKGWGAHIFRTGLEYESDPFVPLQQYEIDENRNILHKSKGDDRVLTELRKILTPANCKN